MRRPPIPIVLEKSSRPGLYRQATLHQAAVVGLPEHLEHRTALSTYQVEHAVQPVRRERVSQFLGTLPPSIRAKALSASVKPMPSAASRRASQLWPLQ